MQYYRSQRIFVRSMEVQQIAIILIAHDISVKYEKGLVVTEQGFCFFHGTGCSHGRVFIAVIDMNAPYVSLAKIARYDIRQEMKIDDNIIYSQAGQVRDRVLQYRSSAKRQHRLWQVPG